MKSGLDCHHHSFTRRNGLRWIPFLLALVLSAFAACAPAASASKQAVDFFGGSGTEGGQFALGRGGLAINNSGAGPANAGDIYVADSSNNRIERFGRDSHGTPADAKDDTYFFISAWGADVVSSGSSGDLGDEAARDYEVCTVASQCKAGLASGGNNTVAGDGTLGSGLPSGGLALDQDTGDLYVSDANNNRVNVYSGDGAFLRSFGYDVVESGPGNAGTGYEICSTGSGDVCKAGLRGAAAGQIGSVAANFGGGSGAAGIALSPPDANPATGTVFLADGGNHRVDTYSLDGTSPSSFGAGHFPAVFLNEGPEPQAIAVDSRGIVYLGAGAGFANNGNFRIERYDSQNANGGGVGFLAPILAPQSEEQVLTENATDGQFRLTFGGQTTGDLPFNVQIGGVLVALEALSSIGPGNVAVTQTSINGVENIRIRFKGTLAQTDVEQVTVSNGTAPLTGSIPVTTTFHGHPGIVPNEPVTALAVDLDEDGAGVEADVLFAGFFNAILQFGPANQPGLPAPPSTIDDTHGDNGAVGSATGLAAEPSTGRLYEVTSGEAGPGVYVLDTPGSMPPEGTLDSLGELSAHGLTAHATINPNGLPVASYHFEYSDNGTTWKSTPSIVLGGQETPQVIEEAIEPALFGLRPNTLYHVRLVYQRRFSAPLTTAELTATTLAVPPLAETTGSTLRTTATATLLGRIDPNDSSATYRFQYGSQGPCDANPCADTAPVSAGASDEFEFASQKIEGLESNTTYHYRIVADNGVGSVVFGGDQTITTRATDAPLSHGNFPGPPGSDRAYELVSLGDSSGNPVGALGPQALSEDGNRAIYSIFGGTPLADSGSAASLYFAQRPPGEHPVTGWHTRLLTPPRDQLISPSWAFFLYGAPDLSSFVGLNLFSGLNPDIGERALWRMSPTSAPTRLFDAVPPTVVASLIAGPGSSYGIAADGSRVVEALRFGALDPAYPAAAAVANFYDVSSGGAPKLLSLMPNGQPPACGLADLADGAFGAIGAQSAHWISEDGSRVLFQTKGDNCTSPAQLYSRDVPAQETKLLSRPPLSGPACEAGLVKATTAAVFFTTQSRLADDDVAPTSCGTGDKNNDVYRYDLATESLECVTCVATGLAADVHGTRLEQIAVSEDGSRVYFTSPARLLPGAAPAGIYRVDVATGQLAYVAPAPGSDIGPDQDAADLSSDGRFLLFHSSNSAFDPLGDAFQNGGTDQYYLYDDVKRSLLCVSCPPNGSPPLAAATPYVVAPAHSGSPGISGLAEDGTLAFATKTPLLGADQNTPAPGGELAPATDVYEWRDGRPSLVSDGITRWPSGISPEVVGISPSGRDLFFVAPARYTADAIDSLRRLYDARVGGGMEFPPEPKPCPLEVCQGTPKGAPEEQSPGTSEFRGLGNSPGKPNGRKCPKGKRESRRNGKTRCLPKRRHKSAQHRAANANRRTYR